MRTPLPIPSIHFTGLLTGKPDYTKYHFSRRTGKVGGIKTHMEGIGIVTRKEMEKKVGRSQGRGKHQEKGERQRIKRQK